MQSFNSSLPRNQLQQKLIQALFELNRKEFSFEEAANPTIPECKVIFEFGLADAESFTYIDQTETQKTLKFLAGEPLSIMDFFCVIRYHRVETNRALKFDYYFIRTQYSEESFEIQIHHKRGPRYLSPEDLTHLILKKINKDSKKQALTPAKA